MWATSINIYVSNFRFHFPFLLPFPFIYITFRFSFSSSFIPFLSASVSFFLFLLLGTIFSFINITKGRRTVKFTDNNYLFWFIDFCWDDFDASSRVNRLKINNFHHQFTFFYSSTFFLRKTICTDLIFSRSSTVFLIVWSHNWNMLFPLKFLWQE